MQLLEFLYENDISQTDFAQRIGISQSSISKYLTGNVTPSVIVALKIQDETGGEVTCRDWESLHEWNAENILS